MKSGFSLPGRARAAIACSMLVLSIGLAAPAQAQWAVSEIGPSLYNHIMNQLNTYTQRFQDSAEYSTEAQRWHQQYQHYTQQLVQVQGRFAQLGMGFDRGMAEVPEDWSIGERCGGDGFSVSALAGQFALNRVGDIRAQQRDVCRRIQLVRNRKYNATVRFMGQVGPRIESHLAELEARRNTSNDNGNVDASVSDTSAFDVKLAGAFSQWEAQMKMYDAYVASLEESQKTLAMMALKGRNDTLGNVIKTTALQGALKVGN